MKKRVLSLFLAITFTLGLLSGAALATEEAPADTPAAVLPTPDENGVITLESNLVLSDTWIITNEVTLNLNGHTISSSKDIWHDDNDNENKDRWSLISVRAGGNLTINGDGTLQTRANDCYAVDVSFGGTCTINGGKYVGNIHAVYVHTGTLTVTGGEFSVQQHYQDESKAFEFTLNCYDPSYADNSAAITVSGGKYFKFDPANNYAEGPSNNFLAEGYTSVADGDYYTVKKADYTVTIDSGNITNGTVSTDKATAQMGDTVTLTIAPSEGYELDTLTVKDADNADVTVSGTGNTRTFEMPAKNVTVTATFKEVTPPAPTTYTVTIDSGIQNGTVTGPASAAAGDTVTLTVTPDGGYELSTLTYTGEGDTEATTVSGTTFVMPAKNVTVTATFTAIPAPAPSVPSRPTTTTTTEKNEDGSTTTTKTNRITGTVTETTKMPDGSSTEVETKKDGTVTTTEKAADGSTTKTVEKPDGSSQTEVKQADGTTASVATDAEGNTQAQVNVSEKAVEAAAEEKKAVALPIPAVEAVKDAETAQAVEVTVPKTAEAVKVEIPVTEVTPGSVAIIVHEDGTEEVVKTSLPTEEGVALTLEGSATVKIVDNSKEFPDVTEEHWAKDYVAFVSARQIFQGDEFGNFTPDGTMTRGMVAAVLHNFENNPEAAVETTFTDMAEDAWYTDAVEWAASQGIVSGYGEGLYGAEDNITREQFVTILYRYTGLRGYDVAGEGDLTQFTDAAGVSDFAGEAMRWAVGVGLLQGDENGALMPQGSATRAQVAAILERFLKLI